MKTHFRLLSALGFAALSAMALADCERGPRAATAAEASYFSQVFAALKGALPAAPSGWTLAPVRDEQVQKFFCEGDREGDFEVRVRAAYTFHISREDSDRIYKERRELERQGDKLQELPPDVAKERQGWLDKMSEANRASNKAEKEGDKKLARKLDNDSEEYSKKAREIRDKYRRSIEPQLAELEARKKTLVSSDTTVNVSIVANEHDAKPVNRNAASELTAGKAPVAKVTGLKVQGVRVIVEGPAPKRDEILNAMDRNKLASLVK